MRMHMVAACVAAFSAMLALDSFAGTASVRIRNDGGFPMTVRGRLVEPGDAIEFTVLSGEPGAVAVNYGFGDFAVSDSIRYPALGSGAKYEVGCGNRSGECRGDDEVRRVEKPEPAMIVVDEPYRPEEPAPSPEWIGMVARRDRDQGDTVADRPVVTEPASLAAIESPPSVVEVGVNAFSDCALAQSLLDMPAPMLPQSLPDMQVSASSLGAAAFRPMVTGDVSAYLYIDYSAVNASRESGAYADVFGLFQRAAVEDGDSLFQYTKLGKAIGCDDGDILWILASVDGLAETLASDGDRLPGFTIAICSRSKFRMEAVVDSLGHFLDSEDFDMWSLWDDDDAPGRFAFSEIAGIPCIDMKLTGRDASESGYRPAIAAIADNLLVIVTDRREIPRLASLYSGRSLPSEKIAFADEPVAGAAGGVLASLAVPNVQSLVADKSLLELVSDEIRNPSDGLELLGMLTSVKSLRLLSSEGRNPPSTSLVLDIGCESVSEAQSLKVMFDLMLPMVKSEIASQWDDVIDPGDVFAHTILRNLKTGRNGKIVSVGVYLDEGDISLLTKLVRDAFGPL